MTMQLSTMGEELASVAIASDSFNDGKTTYKKGGLLAVWYYKAKKNGKPDENGAWCRGTRGTVRDDGINHIVDINNTDNMQCTCNYRYMPCRHAVALIMHIAQDDTFGPMPDIRYEDMPTYIKEYTKDDELADEKLDMHEYETVDEFDFIFMGEKKIIPFVAKPFDRNEARKQRVEMDRSDFEHLIRNGPEGISDLRSPVKRNLEYNMNVMMRLIMRRKGVGTAQFAAEFDIDVAWLQKGALIYADSALKKNSHIRLLVDAWAEADRRYAKCCCRQALVELATYDKEWKNNVEKTLKKMIRESTSGTAKTNAAGADDTSMMYGSDVAWLCRNVLKAAGKGIHVRGK